MKKTLLKALLILLVASLLILPGCKKTSYNIMGTWVFTSTLLGQSFEEIYTFQGFKGSGDVIWEGQVLGNYSSTGDVISFILQYYDIDDDYTVEHYNGTFDGPNSMSGSFTFAVDGYETATGTWFADR